MFRAESSIRWELDVSRSCRGDKRWLVSDDGRPDDLSTGTLTGGTWVVGPNSSMSLGADITTNAAAVVLNGANTNFGSLAALTAISSTGSLEVTGGGSFTTSGNLTTLGSSN